MCWLLNNIQGNFSSCSAAWIWSDLKQFRGSWGMRNSKEYFCSASVAYFISLKFVFPLCEFSQRCLTSVHQEWRVVLQLGQFEGRLHKTSAQSLIYWANIKLPVTWGIFHVHDAPVFSRLVVSVLTCYKCTAMLSLYWQVVNVLPCCKCTDML
jgi:hypothetical protein